MADVLILGGGAAGLFCAAIAGRRGHRVRVLERANKVGKKILMSGGGRCNFTNLRVGPEHFLSANPHFCKSALARYTPEHFIALVRKHGIAFHEKELGQLFCDDSAKQIVQMLLDECAAAGAQIETAVEVQAVKHGSDGFTVSVIPASSTMRRAGIPKDLDARVRGHDSEGSRVRGHDSDGSRVRGHDSRDLRADKLVVATGGLSVPTLGGSGLGYELARQFGHALQPTRAGLVPLTLSGRPLEQWQDLAGLSLPVTASAGKASFSNAMLVTHRGISGPAILQISNYWEPGVGKGVAAEAAPTKNGLRIDLLPGRDAFQLLVEAQRARPRIELVTLMAEWWPRRFAERFVDVVAGAASAATVAARSVAAEAAPTRLADYSHDRFREIARAVHDWPIVPSRTEGYRTAEITLGGVDTREISSTTFESKRVPGLYFIGEVLDVAGWLGGYNFQWAWASAHACGAAL